MNIDSKSQLVQLFEQAQQGSQAQQVTGQIQALWIQQGFCMQMMELADDKSLNFGTRQLALTQLKSAIERHWRHDLSVGEKDLIKNSLLEAMVRVAGEVLLLKLYESILSEVCKSDYPKNFGQLDAQIVSFLSQEVSLEHLTVGLVSVKKLSVIYEFQMDQDKIPLQILLGKCLGLILQLLRKIAQVVSEPRFMVLLIQIFRIFKRLFTISIPEYFKENRSDLTDLVAKMTFLLAQKVEEGGENKSYWKVKKLVNKILQRILMKNQTQSDVAQQCFFYEEFVRDFNTPLLQIQLQILDEQRTKVMPREFVILSLRYLYFSFRLKVNESILQEYLFKLMTEVCLPLVKFSHEDKQSWLNDPLEFIRKEDDFTSASHSIKRAAYDLLERICKIPDSDKKLPYLSRLFQFFYETLKVQREQAVSGSNGQTISDEILDGVLWVFGELSRYLQADQVLKKHVEPVLTNFVFPLFKSPCAWLQGRAAWLYGQYGFIEFQEVQILQQVTVFLVQLLSQKKDSVLQFKAGVALNYVLTKKETRQVVEKNLNELLESYLEIIARIDNEAMVTALEGFVNNFKDSIAPFALQLTQSLTRQFFLLQTKEEDEEEEGDAQMASASLFSTIKTILKTDLSLETLYSIIECILPMLDKGFEFDAEFLDETAETFTAILQKLPQIPPLFWDYFSYFCYVLVGFPENIQLAEVPGITEKQITILDQVRGGWGMDLIDKLLPVLKLFIQKDPNNFFNSTNLLGQKHLQNVFEIILQAQKPENLEADFDQVEMVATLHLYYAILENSHNHDPSLLAVTVLQETIKILSQNYEKSIPVYQNAILNVAAFCFYLAPQQSLEMTNKFACTKPLILKIVETTPKIKNEFEATRIMLFFASAFQNLNLYLQNGIDQEIFQNILKQLPLLTTKILEFREEDDEDENEEEEGYEEESDYQEYLYPDYGYNYNSPLDQIDELVLISNTLQNIFAQAPEFFNAIYKVLTTEETQTLQNNFEEAKKQYQEYLQAKNNLNIQ